MVWKVALRWLRRVWSRREPIADDLWLRVVDDVLCHYRLNEDQLARLRDLSSRFLFAKSIGGAAGFEVDAYVRAVIASVACLLILELDLDYYDGWVEVIVYPDSFIVDHEVVDDIGVLHRERAVLGGESWDDGPLILSWADARPFDEPGGANVIIHEFAHKLDMLNGGADGFPPLHRDMKVTEWTRSFERAYGELCQQLEAGNHTWMDPYASEGPAEFFAVASEAFFETPRPLRRVYPAVYEQLHHFYRQDPAEREIGA
ncbi:MAG: zinc-dependent peptidase [Proteobacteria bacterium]|nr:zinc-dependent peptidase [Pseudomonadota bacterium]